jgi:hypothetical protein
MRTVAVVGNQTARRRSTRMTLNSAIVLSGEDRHKCSFALSITATNLNRYGATIQLNRELSVGSTLVLRNKRGTQVSAQVVRQVSAVERVYTYGIEFLEKDDHAKQFWGITFPTPQSPL